MVWRGRIPNRERERVHIGQRPKGFDSQAVWGCCTQRVVTQRASFNVPHGDLINLPTGPASWPAAESPPLLRRPLPGQSQWLQAVLAEPLERAGEEQTRLWPGAMAGAVSSPSQTLWAEEPVPMSSAHALPPSLPLPAAPSRQQSGRHLSKDMSSAKSSWSRRRQRKQRHWKTMRHSGSMKRAQMAAMT